MYYFLYFLLLSKETHQFYNTALSILTQDNIYVNLDNVKPEDTDFLLYKNELNTADTYLETQQLGNCTYRSSYLGTIVYMVLINGFSINNFEDWIIVLKLSLIKGYLEFYLDTLQTKTDNHEYDLMYSYVVNSYSEIYLKIHSTNPKFNVLLDQINQLINSIEKINIYEKKPFDKLNTNAFVNDYVFINPVVTPLTTTVKSVIDKTIHNIIQSYAVNSKPRSYYALFRWINLNNQTMINHLMNKDASDIGSYLINPVDDLRILLTKCSDYFLKNDTEVLNPYILAYYLHMNELSKYFAHHVDLPKLVVPAYLHITMLSIVTIKFVLQSYPAPHLLYIFYLSKNLILYT
jgi:hypothetical protein